MKQGKFICLEGIDGSGKTEQFKKLVEKLKTEGFTITAFDFPQYGKPSAYFIEQYLNGFYGNWEEVGPYKASVFYALDRFAVASAIKEALNRGELVLSNRYVASNMGHQGAKIKNHDERLRFFKWVQDFEYNILGIPRPDLTIVLHVPAEIAHGLIDKKGSREYIGGLKRDIHEIDIVHLKQAEAVYLELVQLFPKEFLLIECVPENKLLSVEEIHKKIRQKVKTLLKCRC